MRKKRKSESEKKTFKEKIAEGFEASKDVLLDLPRVEMLGEYEVVIENYKSIVEYTSEKIVLDANPRQIRINGRNLEINSVAREVLFISGNIDSVVFLKEG